MDTTTNINEWDVIEVATKLYYEKNPDTKMDVPSFAFETVDKWKYEWLDSNSKLSLYKWIKENKNIK
jgi:hypothetical protein